jgi:hypothetical protein
VRGSAASVNPCAGHLNTSPWTRGLSHQAWDRTTDRATPRTPARSSSFPGDRGGGHEGVCDDLDECGSGGRVLRTPGRSSVFGSARERRPFLRSLRLCTLRTRCVPRPGSRPSHSRAFTDPVPVPTGVGRGRRCRHRAASSHAGARQGHGPADRLLAAAAHRSGDRGQVGANAGSAPRAPRRQGRHHAEGGSGSVSTPR